MKHRKLELDVDFIGGQGTMTIEEEKSLNDFFKQRKLSSQKTQKKTTSSPVKRSKATA